MLSSRRLHGGFAWALLIRNGRIITPTDDVIADIWCADETITRIERGIDPAAIGAEQVIDAAGHYVMPGFIDPHVHVHLPFMGTHAKDDWASVSRAALLGGTTTLIEMICPERDADLVGAFEDWSGRPKGERPATTPSTWA